MDLMPCSSPCVYQITRDNLGSAIQYASKNGVRYRYSYSPWGVRTHQVGGNTVFYQPSDDSPFGPFYRTYTGHEDLWMFGLLNANARLYSPYLGRFISPDPLLNSEGGPLDYNPYIYARNNPYRYIDRNGEFFWLVAIGAAALVGGATYSISAAITGNWNVGDFFKSMGMSAFSAGLSIGLGGLLGPIVGNQFAYGLLSSTSNYFITSAVFGEKISFADIPSIVVGAVVNSSLPTYSPSGANPIVNGFSEIAFNTVRGAITGFASGTVNAMMHDDPSLVWKGIAGGAISGFTKSTIQNAVFGAPYKPERVYSSEANIDIVYRKGGLAQYFPGAGIALGRYVYTDDELARRKGAESLMQANRYHETEHIQQINRMGWANFYGRTIYEYLRFGFKGAYHNDTTLEWQADEYGYRNTGENLHNWHGKIK